AGKTALLAVTILTSLSQQDLRQTGVSYDLEEQVVGLTEIALRSGMDGIVCSAHEIERLRSHLGPGPILMVPGIPPAAPAMNSDDQHRVMTPREAIQAGATHLVIGRPITQAPDPVAAARAIMDDIAS